MAEEKNKGLLKGIVVVVLLVVAVWFIFSIQKSPNITLDSIKKTVVEGVDEGMRRVIQDKENPLDMEVNNLTVKKDETVEGKQTVNGDQDVKGSQTIEKNSIVNGDQTVKGNQNVEKDQTVTGNVTVKGNETVEGDQTVNGNQTVKGDQTIEGDSTVNGDQTIKGDQFINGDQTIGGCQKHGSCGVSTVSVPAPVYHAPAVISAPVYTAPSCTSTCSTEGQSRCTPGCLTGDQRDVCVRSGNCLIWQRQDCTGGQYCDSGTCRTRAAVVVVTDRRCYNGDVWTYTNGNRQNLSEDCGDSHYISGQVYRCSGDRKEYQERVETRCVEPVVGQAQCTSETFWLLSQYCSNGCYNNECRQVEVSTQVVVTPACTSGCCSGNCGQSTVVVNNNIIINNQTQTASPTPTEQTGYMPPPKDEVSHGCTGCIAGPDPNPTVTSFGTGYIPAPSTNGTGYLPAPSSGTTGIMPAPSSSCTTGTCGPGPDPL